MKRALLVVPLGLFALFAALAGTGCSEDAGSAGPADVADGSLDPDSGDDVTAAPRYDVTIRRTSWGVPHILADDYGSLGYGVGYAQAQDHVCTLADQVVKVHSERARYFGPGPGDANLTSDFAFLNLGFYGQVEAGYAEQTEEMRALLDGFAAGYNRYLDDIGLANLPPDCADAAWVTPITGVDVGAIGGQVALLSSSLQVLDMVATAQPPGEGKRAPVLDLEGLPDFRARDYGSNGWALGAERTEHGGGLLLANPHFPWEGELRFWEVHVTIPGELDAYGGAILGSPLPVIGFNEHLGWTHTVSFSQQLTGYLLRLPPGEPTSYRYDGGVREMTASDFTIEVLQPDGTLQAVSRTLYRSHYGPIVNVAPLGWSDTLVLSYRDANEANVALGQEYLDMARARSLDELRAAMAEHASIPFLHTMVADDEGNAFYVDASQVPNLSPEALANWFDLRESDVLTRTAWADFGLVLLDGGDPMNEWVGAPGARVPGLVPFAQAPQLLRRDFVANGNDSHWLANPAEPLEGYSFLYGEERQPEVPRPRTALLVLTESDGSLAGEDGLWSPDEVEAAFFSGRGIVAEMWREALVERCTASPSVEVGGEAVDLTEACGVLAAWDGRHATDSAGAVLFRELLGAFDVADYLAGTYFSDPFDPDDPVATPSGLADPPAEGADPILVALGRAVARLESAGFGLDATLADLQFTERGGQRFPVPGGLEAEGALNIVGWSSLNSSLLPAATRGPVLDSATALTAGGYQMNYGSSLIMIVAFGEDGPVARGLLTYSESDDPGSPWFVDQTAELSAERFRDIAFTEVDIAADPELSVVNLTSP